MLTKLLEMIDQGKQFSQIELAQKMGVNPFFLNSMLQQLVKMGYLEDLSCTVTDGCAGCTAKGACFAGTSPRIWTITEKGRRALQTAKD